MRLFFSSLILIVSLSAITIEVPNSDIGAYHRFHKTFAQLYSEAIELSPHLGSQMPLYPGTLYLGFGSGMVYANKEELREIDVINDIQPDTMGFGAFNYLLGFSHGSWLHTMAFFPNQKVSLPPESIKGVSRTYITLANAKIKSEYVFFNRATAPGISLGAYATYAGGQAQIISDEVFIDEVQNSASYQAELEADWAYFGSGAEIKAWMRAFFIAPYAGYGVGVHGGQLNSFAIINGSVNYEGFEAELPIELSSYSKTQPELFIFQRFFFGLEIDLYLLSVIVDFQVSNRLSGVSGVAVFRL